MISITIERSPALERLVGAGEAQVRRAGLLAAARGAEAYVDMVHDWIGAGRAFTPRTGLLEQSIGWRPTQDGAEVYAQAPHAGYVEHGTGLFGPAKRTYEIKPKPGRKALRWYGASGGGVVFAGKVTHKGSQAQPYFFADLEARKATSLGEARKALAEVLLGGVR